MPTNRGLVLGGVMRSEERHRWRIEHRGWRFRIRALDPMFVEAPRLRQGASTEVF
jgi:hypothetical protein